MSALKHEIDWLHHGEVLQQQIARGHVPWGLEIYHDESSSGNVSTNLEHNVVQIEHQEPTQNWQNLDGSYRRVR